MSTLLSRNIWNVDIEIAFGWHLILTCCFSQLSNAACVFCICFQWQGCEPSLATHCHLSRLAGQRVRAIITKSKLSISSFHDFACAIQMKKGWPTTTRTHTIISALMGFTLVENGGPGVNVGNPNIFNGSGVFKVFKFFSWLVKLID